MNYFNISYDYFISVNFTFKTTLNNRENEPSDMNKDVTLNNQKVLQEYSIEEHTEIRFDLLYVIFQT